MTRRIAHPVAVDALVPVQQEHRMEAAARLDRRVEQRHGADTGHAADRRRASRSCR